MPQTINKKNKIFCKQNIPNMLIVFRVVLTLIVVVLLLIPIRSDILSTKTNFPLIYELWSPLNSDMDIPYTQVYLNELLAGLFFALACLTDWLDGFLARKYNWVSDFGKLWDPIADKILINSVLICFAYLQMIPAFIPIIMIARDVAVDANRMVAASKKIIVAANWYGKAKTVVQMVACFAIFFILNCSYEKINYYMHSGWDQRALWWGVQNLAMYAATLVSIVSGIKYFIEIAQKTKEVKNVKSKN